MKESDLVAGRLPGEEYCRGLLMKESVWLQVDYLARNIGLLMKISDLVAGRLPGEEYCRGRLASAPGPDHSTHRQGNHENICTRELLEKR
jgi:hypothetical protein